MRGMHVPQDFPREFPGAWPTEFRFSTADMLAEPDYSGLQAALARRPREPMGLYQTAQTIWDVGANQRAAHMNPAFAYGYGLLSFIMADGIHRPWRYSNTGLTPFEDPDELEVQAFNFGERFFEPAEDAVAICTGTPAERHAAELRIAPTWRQGLLDPRVQLKSPAVYFVSAGMTPHILNPQDLLRSLDITGVSPRYMDQKHKGGFFITDEWIKFTAHILMSQLVAASPGRVRVAGTPVAPTIAMMRRKTHGDFMATHRVEDGRFVKIDDDLLVERVEQRASARAMMVAKTVLHLGDFGLDVFELIARDRSWQSFLGGPSDRSRSRSRRSA